MTHNKKRMCININSELKDEFERLEIVHQRTYTGDFLINSG